VRDALAFLTPLPVGTARPPDERTLRWFPAVGILVGLLVGASWWVAVELFPLLVAAALTIVVDVALTGALHLDGLADTADGLFAPHRTPATRRAIMARPDVGAFGAVAVAVVLVLRWSALSSIPPDAALVAALWCASRAAMAVALVRLPYVGGGLGIAFAGASVWPAVAGVAVAGVLDAATAGVTGVAGVVAVLLGGAGVVALGRARLGGVTGDVLGAAGVVGETLGLVVASASW
jgi:adenosylcobinamide-GDP ribazoletransferase